MKQIALIDVIRGLGAVLLTPMAALAQIPGPPSSPAAPAPATPAPEGMGAGLLALAVPLVLLAIIVAAVKLYDMKRKRDEEAMALEARISDTLLLHPSLAGCPVVASVHMPLSKRSEPLVEVAGTVPSEALRDIAVDLVKRELRSQGLPAQVQDRVMVDPLVLKHVA